MTVPRHVGMSTRGTCGRYLADVGARGTAGFDASGPAATQRGMGWLRTRTLGASTARYEIVTRRDDEGVLRQVGLLRAEGFTMIEARAARNAVLVLECGDPVRIVVHDLTPAGLAFEVVDEGSCHPRHA